MHIRTTAATLAALTGLAMGVFSADALARQNGRQNAPQGADEHPPAGMLRFPDVSDRHIVFVYANDLWIVDRDGGDATPLASPAGQELYPRFSPDGKHIAFVGNYEGGRDIYTVPLAGGVPRRVTHHPTGELLADWTESNGLLFAAGGMGEYPREAELFTVSPEGGLPVKLPVPYGGYGAISPDGEWLAYLPHQRDFRTWKRYRGGMASDIWLYNLRTGETRRLTDWEGTDSFPMWNGEDLYYLSDRGDEHRLNIWRWNSRTDEHEQVTRFTDYDVKFPAIGPGERRGRNPAGAGEIVFQNGPDLYLLDLGRNAQPRRVEVRIPGAKPKLATRTVDAKNFMGAQSISPSAKRVAAEARGDIWTLPAEKGTPRNLTATNGAAERDPAWSPDGRWIAYFSDESGEYELCIRQSDGRGPVRQLTSDSRTYYFSPVWSPNSERIAFTDKAGNLYVHTLGERRVDDAGNETFAEGVTEIIDRDAWGNRIVPSWSHDSRWLAYAKANPAGAMTSAVFLYDLDPDAEGELPEDATEEQKARAEARRNAGPGPHQVTSYFFSDERPVFDRTGDHLYFVSSRTFSPTYSDIDSTFIYENAQVLVAVPLREDVEHPLAPESDEQEWEVKDEKKDAEEDENGEDADDENGGADDADEAGDDDAGDQGGDAAADPVSGSWSGSVSGGSLPEAISFSLTLELGDDGTTVTGTLSVMGAAVPIENGRFEAATGRLTFRAMSPNGAAEIDGRIEGDTFRGTATVGGENLAITMTRAGGGEGAAASSGGKKPEPADVVRIDLAGFEARAFRIPVASGRFGALGVNKQNQLLYVRPDKGIMLVDIRADEIKEETVAAGQGSFQLSAEGDKLLAGGQIFNASAGASGKAVVTDGMRVRIDPREEWNQIFNDAWRRHRDFFYVENMHGVDWERVREDYARMVEFANSREDLSFIIGEMISELNVGHAYYWGGDGENEPSETVGMLGVDFERVEGEGGGAAYRIAKILGGAPWDLDARSPLSAPGVGVEEGDFLLAVNGVPVDADRDPWAAFQGLANKTVTLTFSEDAQIDAPGTPEGEGNDKEVVVRLLASEDTLRYRDWVETNRRTVEELSGGKVGYIYVPNTGVDGQNELFRQFYGQAHLPALLIDERWNGGGQIPNRFIELLNRPRTNYWARRDGKDWPWPYDSHQGPKAMLINGRAGSGGDMFPWLFRHHGIGKLIGTRTWGGLVGISGVPGLIDGGYTAVPTFGFYELDGTWGIEGHGVDPDIEVLDDPAQYQDGVSPQLRAGVEHLLRELETNAYTPPQRPADPDRSRMGITESDR